MNIRALEPSDRFLTHDRHSKFVELYVSASWQHIIKSLIRKSDMRRSEGIIYFYRDTQSSEARSGKVFYETTNAQRKEEHVFSLRKDRTCYISN